MVRQLVKALEIIRSHDETMPVQRAATFLYVAERGKVTREGTAEDLGQSKASAYRNLMALSTGTYTINVKSYEGLGWLEAEYDTTETRRLVWRLSQRGRRIIQQLEEVLSNARSFA